MSMTVTAPALLMTGDAVIGGLNPGPAIEGPRVTVDVVTTVEAATVVVMEAAIAGVMTVGVDDVGVTIAETSRDDAATVEEVTGVVMTAEKATEVPGRNEGPSRPGPNCRRRPPTGSWTPRSSGTWTLCRSPWRRCSANTSSPQAC